MKKDGALTKKIITLSAVAALLYFAIFVAFVITFMMGMDKVAIVDKSPVYYFSSDNTTELIVLPTKYSRVNAYIVNGREVSRSGGSPAETFYNLTKQRIPPIFLVALGLFAVLMAVPNRVGNKLFYHFRTTVLALTYKKARGEKLTLPKAPAGVIAVRNWGLNHKGLLTSINQGKVWSGLVYEDKTPPSVHSLEGLYAFRLGGNHSMWYRGSRKVAGMVSLSGKVISHHDHILRAQKATILCLIARSEKDAKKLRNHYYCPIFVNTNPVLAIETWAMSEQGLFWQHHNNELIKEKREEGMVDSIESLTAYKEFSTGKKEFSTGKYVNVRFDGDNIRIADCTQCGKKNVSVIHHHCVSESEGGKE